VTLYLISRRYPEAATKNTPARPAGSLFNAKYMRLQSLQAISLQSRCKRYGPLPAYHGIPDPTPLYDPRIHRSETNDQLEDCKIIQPRPSFAFLREFTLGSLRSEEEPSVIITEDRPFTLLPVPASDFHRQAVSPGPIRRVSNVQLQSSKYYLLIIPGSR
jgi:hypothetical protein